MEYEEGDPVVESILGGVPAYSTKSSNPPTRASRTDEERQDMDVRGMSMPMSIRDSSRHTADVGSVIEETTR